MPVSSKLSGGKHSLNRLNLCEKNKKMEIFSQAGHIYPNFAFQIDFLSKMLKKLAKNDKNGKFCYIVYLRFWYFHRFLSK